MKQALQKLADLFSLDQHKKACVLALIIDATAPHPVKGGNDFVVTLKIIDSSLNQDSFLGTQGKRYCHVFIFSRLASQLPQVRDVGSLIYLRRAQFKKWNGQFQAKLSHSTKYSSWVIFNGDPSKYDLQTIQTNRDQADPATKFHELTGAASELRTFSFNYLRRHSVPLYQSPLMSSDTDFILKVRNCQPFGEKYLLTLTDLSNNFQMVFSSAIEAEAVVKVRSVSKVDWTNLPTLLTRDYSWLMVIADWMKSFNQITTIVNQQPENVILAQTNNIVQSEPQIYSQLRDAQKLSIVQLAELQKVSGNRSRLRCWVVDLSVESLAKGLRKLHQGRLFDFSHSQGVGIYQMPIQVQDSSLKCSQSKYVYLFSYDGKGNQIFDGIDPRKVTAASMESQQQIFLKVKNDLIEFTNENNQIELIVECFGENQEERLWRVVDTVVKDFI